MRGGETLKPIVTVLFAAGGGVPTGSFFPDSCQPPGTKDVCATSMVVAVVVANCGLVVVVAGSADHPGSAGPQVRCMEEHSHGIHEELTKIHDNSRTMALGNAGHSPSSPRGRMRVDSTGEPQDCFRPS